MEGGSLIVISVLATPHQNLMCLVSNRGIVYLNYYNFNQKTSFPRTFQEVTGQGKND
jgi:hypothetical protein